MSRPNSHPQPARGAVGWVFLDRDGTLNLPPPTGRYIERPQDLELLPGAARGLAMLNRAGFWTGLVTNQRGIALGHMGHADVEAVHGRLAELLAPEGARLDAIYVCPHAQGECSCRKPAPGLLLRARAEHPGIDFARTWIVGDKLSDVQAGHALGLRTLLIAGPAAEPEAEVERAVKPDHLVADLVEAAELVISAATEPRDLGGSGAS